MHVIIMLGSATTVALDSFVGSWKVWQHGLCGCDLKPGSLNASDGRLKLIFWKVI